MTSSDVLDTCFNLQLKQSGKILLKDIDQLLSSIKRQAIKAQIHFMYWKKPWYSMPSQLLLV